MRRQLGHIAHLNRTYGSLAMRRTALLIILIGVAIGLLEALVLRAITDLAGLITNTGESRSSFPVIGELGGAGTVALSVGATMLVIILRWIDAQAATRVSLMPMEQVRSDLAEAFLRAGHTEQQRHQAGKVQEVLSTHAPTVGITFLGLASGLSAIVIVLVLSAVAVSREPLAFIALVLALIVVAAFVAPLQRRIAKHSHTLGQEQIRYGEQTSGTVQLSQELKLYAGASDAVLGRLDTASSSLTQAATRLMALTRFASNLYRSLILLLLVGGLGLMVMADVGSVTATGAVVLLLIRALMESQLVYSNIALVAEKLPYAITIDAMVQDLVAETSTPGHAPLGPVSEVALTDASYHYQAESTEPAETAGMADHAGAGDANHDASSAQSLDVSAAPVSVLTDVSLRVARGERVGIVGPSGQGKSTLLALVAGLVEPTSGTVQINGQAPISYDRSSLSRQVAMVPQTARLLTSSIRDNVQFFRDWVSDADVEWAMRSVGLHDEVVSWRDGYDTVVGHRGARGLSGGQAQRVCVARALAGRPSLLLMDEPTSALDDLSEALFTDALTALGDQCTAIVVSHRKSALSACTRVVALSEHGLRDLASPASAD